tara:strand:- start:7092 stop:7964 length:873 start_codon:yes stop_codon:yes gene_type:complete
MKNPYIKGIFDTVLSICPDEVKGLLRPMFENVFDTICTLEEQIKQLREELTTAQDLTVATREKASSDIQALQGTLTSMTEDRDYYSGRCDELLGVVQEVRDQRYEKEQKVVELEKQLANITSAVTGTAYELPPGVVFVDDKTTIHVCLRPGQHGPERATEAVVAILGCPKEDVEEAMQGMHLTCEVTPQTLDEFLAAADKSEDFEACIQSPGECDGGLRNLTEDDSLPPEISEMFEKIRKLKDFQPRIEAAIEDKSLRPALEKDMREAGLLPEGKSLDDAPGFKDHDLAN